MSELSFNPRTFEDISSSFSATGDCRTLRRFRLIKANFAAGASPTGNASSRDHGPEDITPSSLILVPGAFFTVG
jgi:hypothetical protein